MHKHKHQLAILIAVGISALFAAAGLLAHLQLALSAPLLNPM